MSEAIETPKSTELSRLDEIVGRLREGSKKWAALPLAEKIAVGRRMIKGYAAIAERSVQAACAAKGIPAGSAMEGEEWLGGPYITIRNLRLTVEALEQLQRTGNTPIGKLGKTIDGRISIQCYPTSKLDAALLGGMTAEMHLEQGVTEEELHRTRASFYKTPQHKGRVSLILGAGNVNSIPPTDVVTKLFNEGKVCVLKMNPINGYLGPFVEEAFKELIERNFLAVVYGGAEEGTYLCKHAGIDEIHITGSDKTHDMIVWGPPGPERAERMARNKPLLEKEITSELGNVSPVLIVPGPWSGKELAFQAENVAGAVTNNASFNCNAAKMLVTAKGWQGKDAFLDQVMSFVSTVPARKAWYPGAQKRYDQLTQGRPGLRVGPKGAEGTLPWTLVPGLDASDRNEQNFSVEPFCAVLSATEVGSAEDPVKFLEESVEFANERLWGTLVATIIVHPETMKDPRMKDAVERAISKLRYGAVGVNLWPSLAFALGTTPWGAYPGSTLTNIQSGRGWVHNTSMVERIEKAVIRHPAANFPKPPFFPTHKTAATLARKLTYFEAEGPSWLKLPPIALAGLRA